MTDYAAFISYASRYKTWVNVLQENLEACLEHAKAEKTKVFLDQVDLSVGRSWIGQLEKGLASSEHLILVITPEALASPRVEDEWQSYISRHKDWQRTEKLLPIVLRDAPLPLFLSHVQHIDFSRHDAYRKGLQELVGGLLRRGKRDLPTLPKKKLRTPEPVPRSLPDELRDELVKALTPLTKKRVYRGFMLGKLKLKPETLLEGYPLPEQAASALLVHARGTDDELTAAHRTVETLIPELAEDEPEVVDKLRALRDRLDEKLEEKDREPSLLERYLDQVARDHEQLVPVFQQRAELDLLDRVYVRLELRADAERMALKAEPTGRLDPQMGIRQLLALDPKEHSWVTRRWVVRGDPGAGKTTLLRHLAAGLAREKGPLVPVFESLPRLLRDREPLLDRLQRKLQVTTQSSADGLIGVLEHEAQQGRLLLLLDGLDEAPDRDEAASLLRELAARWPQATLVVTTRPIGYRRPDNAFVEVDIQPLDEDRQRTFLARWFGRHDGREDQAAAGEALERLQAASSLSVLAGNPLYLTLMALLIERGETLSRRRGPLYDQVFQLLLDGGHRPDGEAMTCQEKAREALRFLAYGMTEENLDALAASKLEERLYQPEADAFREVLERVPRWRRGMRPFLDELSQRTGILGPHDGPDADWRYWHRTFREALASEELASLYHQPDGEAEILEHAGSIQGDLSRWAEPYALLTGRLEKPDELVRALMKENRALGLRALGTAQALKDQTLNEVLELSEEWLERIEVYAQLVDLVDDPDRLLLLLNRLRERTRNGNDLFHLDLTFGEVAKRWPDAAMGAEALRSHLFAHIPAPNEDLFRWIKTPQDGRVELWKTIPSGFFLMGSPDDEEGRLKREDPQHLVEIESSFALAAVPITNAQFSAFDSEKKPRGWQGVSEEELSYHPAVNVTGFQATMFCRWLSQTFHWAKGARLPSEEEWEYACRAETVTRYWSGNTEKDLDRVGWYHHNSGFRTHRVGEKAANPWGLYDVHGNVWEWTSSEVGSYDNRELFISVNPRSDLSAPSGYPSPAWAFRGGSYWDSARGARSAYRLWIDPALGSKRRGFRILLPNPPS